MRRVIRRCCTKVFRYSQGYSTVYVLRRILCIDSNVRHLLSKIYIYTIINQTRINQSLPRTIFARGSKKNPTYRPRSYEITDTQSSSNRIKLHIRSRNRRFKIQYSCILLDLSSNCGAARRFSLGAIICPSQGRHRLECNAPFRGGVFWNSRAAVVHRSFGCSAQ